MDYESLKRENLSKTERFEKSVSQGTVDCAFDGGVDFYPRYIQLEHTTRCNAQCVMCNHLYAKNNGAKDLDINVLYKIEEILKYAEIVMLNGDGEPFLCKDIEKSLALFQKYRVKVGTNTNLSVLSDDVWGYLRDGFSFLNVSCDGSYKELYERIRRGLSFDTFVGNLNKLNEVAPDLDKNLDCVLMRQNICDMKNLVEFAARYKFKSVRFHMLGVNPVIANEEDAPELYPNYLAENAEAAKARSEELGIDIRLPKVNAQKGDYQKDLSCAQAREPFSRKRIAEVASYEGYEINQHLSELVSESELAPSPYNFGGACRWAIERCFIDVCGNMTTCCYNVDKRFGNLSEQSFQEVWNGKLYKAFRKEMCAGRLPIWCKTCQWLKNPKF